MYTWEIQKELEKYNYCIESKIYLNIVRNSPQIILVEYKPFDNKYRLVTRDGLDVEFIVYCNDYK